MSFKLKNTDINAVNLKALGINRAYLGSTLVFGEAVSAFDFTTDLVASWQFENDFNDYTGVHNATKFGSVTNNTTGKVGNQADFLGSDDYLFVNDSDDFSFTDGVTDLPFSIFLWVKVDGYPNANPRVIGKRDGTNSEWQILIVDNSFRIVLLNSNANAQINIDANTSLNLGQWYQLVVTYTGSGLHTGLKMYLDGVSVGVSSEINTYIGMTNTQSPVYIGAYYNNGSIFNELDGKLDEVKVYKNRVLTQEEITYMYDQENSGNSVLP